MSDAHPPTRLFELRKIDAREGPPAVRERLQIMLSEPWALETDRLVRVNGWARGRVASLTLESKGQRKSPVGPSALLFLKPHAHASRVTVIYGPETPAMVLGLVYLIASMVWSIMLIGEVQTGITTFEIVGRSGAGLFGFVLCFFMWRSAIQGWRSGRELLWKRIMRAVSAPIEPE